jgi:hypothetical protein
MCEMPDADPVPTMEESMRTMKSATGIAIVSGVLALAVSSASAVETSNVSGCLAMQSQVKSALESNAQSANYRDAKKQQQVGLDYCSSGLFDRGVKHYAEALKLLGVGQS